MNTGTRTGTEVVVPVHTRAELSIDSHTTVTATVRVSEGSEGPCHCCTTLTQRAPVHDGTLARRSPPRTHAAHT